MSTGAYDLKVVTVDFETESIELRPAYPPIATGVAIKRGGVSKYYSWGHPSQNNCTKREAVKILRGVYKTENVLFHNASFDIEVGTTHLNLPIPRRYHDTLLLAFIFNPYEEMLGLKPLADKYLDMPPEEQLELKDWIVKNIADATEKNWGEYISKAPGKLVGKYAIGDVVRTHKLYRWLAPLIRDMGAWGAYERELALIPINVYDMEQEGIRVNLKRLEKDVVSWEDEVESLEKKIFRRMKTEPFNIGSSAQLANALVNMFEKNNTVNPDGSSPLDNWPTTPTGKLSTKTEILQEVIVDTKLLQLLERRSSIRSSLDSFAYPWLKTDGRIRPQVNSVRGKDQTKGKGGARTGRYSYSNPNLQNVTRKPEDPTLPFLRSYLVPEPGTAFLKRDYSQQEIRILAHFEDGALMAQYQKDPTMDVHGFAQQLIQDKTGLLVPREHVKRTAFGIIYGMGIAKLAKSLHIPYEDAKKLKAAYLAAIPGIKQVMKELRTYADNNLPMQTWGGRPYFCEAPKIINGQTRTFEYKMINTLIQGSAADCTKQAIINTRAAIASESRIVLSVHDEILVCCDKGYIEREMRRMREAMSDVDFDVPMLSDGFVGRKNWGQVVTYKDKQ